jgi:hypothetical protein
MVAVPCAIARPGRTFAALVGGADEAERAISDTNTTATIAPAARAEINSFARAVRQSLPIS